MCSGCRCIRTIAVTDGLLRSSSHNDYEWSVNGSGAQIGRERGEEYGRTRGRTIPPNWKRERGVSGRQMAVPSSSGSACPFFPRHTWGAVHPPVGGAPAGRACSPELLCWTPGYSRTRIWTPGALSGTNWPRATPAAWVLPPRPGADRKEEGFWYPSMGSVDCCPDWRGLPGQQGQRSYGAPTSRTFRMVPF